jgi:hypothetical protein
LELHPHMIPWVFLIHILRHPNQILFSFHHDNQKLLDKKNV